MPAVQRYDEWPKRLMVLLFVEGKTVRGTDTVALIDTGAETSCIRSDLALGILGFGLRDIVGNTQIDQPAAVGRSPSYVVPCYMVTFKVVLEDERHCPELSGTLEMAAMEDLGPDTEDGRRIEILLGMDFLKTIHFGYAPQVPTSAHSWLSGKPFTAE
jgi:hypothetical protein